MAGGAGDLEGRDATRAVRQREPAARFERAAAAEAHEVGRLALHRIEPRPPRPHQPAIEELERHRAFISRMVNPLWARFTAAS